MLFFRKHPCRFCLVSAACQETCKETHSYIFRCANLINLWEKIGKVLCGVTGAFGWLLARYLFSLEKFDKNTQMFIWISIVLLITLITNMTTIFIFKYIRKRLFILSKKHLHPVDIEIIFPEYCDTNFLL